MNLRDDAAEMLAYASHEAEEKLATDGRVVPAWHAFNDEAPGPYVVPPPPSRCTEVEAIELLRELFLKLDVVAYAFVAENNRRDEVILAVDTRGGFALATRRITRRGATVKLGPVVLADEATLASGDFIGFVPLYRGRVN